MKSVTGLASLGSVIRLSTGEWEARMRIRAEDIGLTSEQVEGLNLGSHRLIKTERLADVAAVARRARGALNKSGLLFLGFEGARFVPYEHQAALLQEFHSAQSEYAAEVSRLLGQYEQFKNEAMLSIAESLQNVAGDRDTAMAAYRRVVLAYPSPEQIARKFYLRWEMFHAVGVGAGGAELSHTEQMEQFRAQAEGMIGGLRRDVLDALLTVQEKIGRGERVRKNTADAVLRAFSRAESLNVLGDPQIARAVERARALFSNFDGEVAERSGTFAAEVAGMAQLLEADLADAVREAEGALTQVGKRRIG